MTKIPRVPVTSSQVKSIGYNPPTQELDIEFAGFGKNPKPAVYRYQNVGPELHAAILSAPSIGRHVNQTIKADKTKHSYRKLTDEEAAQ